MLNGISGEISNTFFLIYEHSISFFLFSQTQTSHHSFLIIAFLFSHWNTFWKWEIRCQLSLAEKNVNSWDKEFWVLLGSSKVTSLQKLSLAKPISVQTRTTTFCLLLILHPSNPPSELFQAATGGTTKRTVKALGPLWPDSKAVTGKWQVVSMVP